MPWKGPGPETERSRAARMPSASGGHVTSEGDPLDTDILSMLVCPSCFEGDLELRTSPETAQRHASEALECHRCNVRYPVLHGVPILLPEMASHPPSTGEEDRPGPTSGAWPGESTGTTETPRAGLSGRLGRARNVLAAQGVGSFAAKACGALRTEVERRVPLLRGGPRYRCPFCGVHSAFLHYRGRPRAQCPNCLSKERDRLLALVVDNVLDVCAESPSVLHVAPEEKIRPLLAPRAGRYVSMDRTLGLSSYAGRLSTAADLTRLGFKSESFDLVLASHVLEHIPDDIAAAREVYRVLRPGGIALLPVPVTHDGPTVEYGAPRPWEEMHVRAPGSDYFRRFEDIGFEVVVVRSSDYPEEHQLRSYHKHGPEAGARSRRAGSEQYVPICYKKGPGGGSSRESSASTGIARARERSR